MHAQVGLGMVVQCYNPEIGVFLRFVRYGGCVVEGWVYRLF